MKKIERRYVKKDSKEKVPNNKINRNYDWAEESSIKKTEIQNYDYDKEYVNKRKDVDREEAIDDSLVFDNSNIKKEDSAISHDKKNYNDNSSYNINHNQSYNNDYRPYPNRYETPSKKSKSNIDQGIKLEFATRDDKEEGVYKKVSDRLINNSRNKTMRVKTDDRLHFDDFSKQDDVLNLSAS
ncbi:hypothetical protein [uncultured Anaerococcus sp.]|uniref:hypothetical protein n=1 Tax=uncultured Anaerococcus sp. TaxID=293428 RepID=UPI0025F00264|nr:hypothetical protein [uncultured Anaerococcus sp.]